MNQIREIRQKNKNFIGEVKPFEVGEGCQLNDCLIDTTGGVKIGNNVHFGHQVMLLTATHPYKIYNGKERMETLELKPIEIDNDAYVATRAVILGGVKIGKSSYVGACSLVLEDTIIGDKELWAGVPARFIKKL